MRVENGMRTMRGNGIRQSARDFLQGRLPGNRLEVPRTLGAHSAQGLQQPARRIAPLAVIARGTLAAQSAAADGMRGIAAHRRDHAVTAQHLHAAGVVAIAGTGGEYDFVARTGRGHGVADPSAFFSNSARICDASRRKGRLRS